MCVHKKTIILCVYNVSTGEVLDEQELPYDLPKVLKYLQKIQNRHGRVHACYEASSYGFSLQRALEAQRITCEVIAPSSVPRRSGKRVKMGRRKVQMLAKLYAAGSLKTIRILDEEQEAIRSVLRCREDLIGTMTRMRQRILAFLQRRGFQYPGKICWTATFHTWARALPMTKIDQNTLQTYLRQLEQLGQEVKKIEASLVKSATKHP